MRRWTPWLFFLVVFAGCSQDGPALLDGTYYGYERVEGLDPDNPENIWFQKHVLTVRDGKVALEKSPWFVHNSRLVSSASDGGFRTYDGSVERVGKRVILGLRQLTCDYCEPPEEDSPLPSSRVVEYVVAIKERGSFEFDHVRYHSNPEIYPWWFPKVEQRPQAPPPNNSLERTRDK